MTLRHLLLAAALAGCGGGAGAPDAGALDASADGAPTGPDADAPRCPPGPRFAVAVSRFDPGERGGFGMELFPDVVLGPPMGSGERQGSLDVLSLGRGGEIVVELGVDAVDGPGDDLVVFENVFLFGVSTPYIEPGAVAVSEDGVTFVPFPCDPAASGAPGCAGRTPVLSHCVEGAPDPFAPEAGGDGFDLATVGLARARYVRITDVGSTDMGAPTEGFDLDAVAVLHPAE